MKLSLLCETVMVIINWPQDIGSSNSILLPLLIISMTNFSIGIGFLRAYFKQLLDEFRFRRSIIIKVEVGVISGSRRLRPRPITLIEALITPNPTKTESSNCLIIHLSKEVLVTISKFVIYIYINKY